MSATDLADVDPPYDYPAYKSTALRAPKQVMLRVVPHPVEFFGPVFPDRFVKSAEADLTAWGKSAPLGEKMILVGRVTDEDGTPVRNSLVELWQCNASGRYAHPVDQHDAPLDPNFLGQGKVLTGEAGEYRFVTVKPGAYPWRNHPWAWRPAHIHLSLFGNAYAQRLVTQLFFPGDPLLDIDPVFNSVPDPQARQRMVCTLDLESGVEEVALGYRFDIVLRGAKSTPMGL
ncbi:MAG: protocatechuate 3,4-dioxygenase subunit beta [Betaproteobacteria bacterium]